MISLVTSMVRAMFSMAKIPYVFTPTPRSVIEKVPATVSASGLRVLLAISDKYNWRDLSTGIVDNSELMSRAGLSAKAVQRGRKQLIEAGIIEAEQQGQHRSPRWKYRFPAEILGLDELPEPKEKVGKTTGQECPEGQVVVDKDVQLLDKDVQPKDKDVQKTRMGEEGAKSVQERFFGSQKKTENEGERISSRNSLKNGSGESESEATAQPKPLAVASGFAGGNKVIDLADKMVALVESRLAAGEVVDLNDWKALAYDALHKDREGAKYLFQSYPEIDLHKEWFTRVRTTHKHWREG